MANHRSVLPKFRPATLGSQRPQIRPVKPTVPPPAPVPLPPRKHSSGVQRPEEVAPPTTAYKPPGAPPSPPSPPAPTQAGMMAAARARIHEIARELPAENRFGGPAPRFEDETQGRFEPQHDAYDALPSLGVDSDSHDFAHDPMTEMRPAYDGALQRHEDAAYRAEPRREEYGSDRPVPDDDSSGKYERGSSRGARDPYTAPSSFSSNSNSYDPAAYEANYPKSPRQEPSYVGRGASDDRRDGRDGNSYRSSAPKSDEYNRSERRGDRDRGQSYRRDDDRDRGQSYRRDERDDDRRGSYQPHHDHDDAPRAPRDETRAEGTGNRDGYGEHIPGPPRIPDGFVVGVQPLRNTPSMSPQAIIQPIPPITPSRGMPQQYVPQSTMGATPNGMMTQGGNNSYGGQSFGQMGMPIMQPMQMQQMQMQMPMQMQMAGGAMPPMVPSASMMGGVRPHTSMRPGGHIAQPTEVEEARQGSKIGRFAWFVFGAAFGIFFAFFATGFGFGKSEEPTNSFPPPAHLPTPVQVGQTPTPVPTVAAPTPTIAQLAPAAPQPGLAVQPGVAPPPTGGNSIIVQPQGVITPPQQFAPVAPAPQQPAARAAAPAQNQGSVRVRPAAPPPPAAPRERSRNSNGSNAEDVFGAALGN